MSVDAGNRVGKAQTVLGLVSPDSLGILMPHEHVFIDTTCMFDPPTEASDHKRAHAPMTIENLGWIRTHYFRHYENLLLDDEEAAVSELDAFRVAGGSTIVDVSTPGIGRDPFALARVARRTGVNIVMATGYYVASTHPREVEAMSEAAIANRMVAEIESGAVLAPATGGDQDWQPVFVPTGVRAGIIKVACSYPLHPAERKVLRAAAVAQKATGASITVHVGRHEASAAEILDVLAGAGADLSRLSLDHLELRVKRFETLLELAETGCMLEFDMFGHESSYYPLTENDMPSDAQRLDLIERLISEGLVDRILVSQDICTRHRLLRYGGHGYGHIASLIVRRMRERRWRDEDVDALVRVNPARLLTLVEPA